MLNKKVILSLTALCVGVLAVYSLRLPVIGDERVSERQKMVVEQIAGRGITDENVLKAVEKVERHHFVPAHHQPRAYGDHPLPIGFDQTISQPYIVAYMTQAAGITPEDKVLEIGTGSGYQAAVLAEIAGEVYSVEIIKELADSARERLDKLGYTNIFIRHGDGYQGWAEHAPYDVIMVTAAPDDVPEQLIAQLKVGGRMVIPVGSVYQELYLIVRHKDFVEKQALLPVRFVPMVEGR